VRGAGTTACSEKRLCSAGVDRLVRRKQRLRGRCEQQAIIVGRVVQRLDADAVARQHQSLPAGIPKAEREHTVQPLHAIRTPLCIGFQDNFGIAARFEAVSFLLELLPELRVVVDGAVEHERVAVGVIDHRLAGFFRQVDDRQPTVTQTNRAIDVIAGAIRSAPLEPVHHAMDARPVRRCYIESQFTTDTTHDLLLGWKWIYNEAAL
jgi:hypothetical protein